MDSKEEFKKLLKTVKDTLSTPEKKFRNEDVAVELGYTRTYLSNLISAKGIITGDHIKFLKLAYPFLSENPTIEGVVVEKKKPVDDPWYRIIDRLTEHSERLSRTNEKLVDAHIKFIGSLNLSVRDEVSHVSPETNRVNSSNPVESLGKSKKGFVEKKRKEKGTVT